MSRYINSNKAQNAIEFLTVISIVVLFLILILVFISQQTVDVTEQHAFSSTEFLANQILEEINLAKNMRDGYSRTFEIPATIRGVPISVELRNGRELIVSSDDSTVLRFLPAFIPGDLSTGSVEILKKGGMVGVCIDSCEGVFPWDLTSDFTCMRSDGVWINCNPQYYIPVQNIRVDCGISSANRAELEITNPERGRSLPRMSGELVSGNMFEFGGFMLNISGTWLVNGTCSIDSEESSSWSFEDSWELPYGRLVARLVEVIGCEGEYDCPANANMELVYEIECIGGECGDVSVYLDPQ